MSNVKIYTATPADLSPPVQSESFCVDLVLASDYRELEAKCASLAAENAALKKSEVEFNDYCRHECEDVGDTWVDDFTVIPATDAFLAEMRAQGVERYAAQLKSEAELADETGWDGAAKFLISESEKVLAFAAQIRQEAAQ
ncbi:ead/Ea22-like family protein [Salmonella enterica subsp. enterica]|nr:ead/Ea22-like family protein [Salmonella enterica subsp. enterica serovar Ank]EBH2789541.1 ead/Ea22-like family protein [Salmonella enterica subsp. enterica serovar Ank]